MSDWRVIENPILQPYKCALCPRAAGTVGQVIDTVAEHPLTGERLYLCSKCTELAARMFGFISDEGTEERLEWRDRISELERQLRERDGRNASMETNLNEARAMIETERTRADVAEQRCQQLQATLARVRQDTEAQLDAVGVRHELVTAEGERIPQPPPTYSHVTPPEDD